VKAPSRISPTSMGRNSLMPHSLREEDGGKMRT